MWPQYGKQVPYCWNDGQIILGRDKGILSIPSGLDINMSEVPWKKPTDIEESGQSFWKIVSDEQKNYSKSNNKKLFEIVT